MNEEEIIQEKNKKRLIKILKIIITTFMLISCLILYSRFISTTGINIKEYKITNNNVPDSFIGIKIVHISDIHYGRTTNKKEIENIVKEINKINPDIVVFSGDLLDTDTTLTEKQQNELIQSLNSINSKLGKFAIKGDDDSEFTEFDKIMNSTDFKVLNNSYELIYNKSNEPILLVGLSSNIKSETSINDRLSIIDEETKDINCNYKILLIHEPDYINEIDYSKYSLILAGHSHGGQIRFPFIGGLIKKDKAKKYYDEYYKLNNTDLYISSGIGTSSINFRLFNKPSFNLYRLTK